ncbi:MAG: helix-turn-helix transcriptional regulator [Bacteroidota bacterium]
MKGTQLGEFEELVLLAIAILQDQAYGLAIKHKLHDELNKNISIGAVHAACNRLEDKGFLQATWTEATKKRGGKRKKCYQVTLAGQRALEYVRDLRQNMWNQLPGSSFQIAKD